MFTIEGPLIKLLMLTLNPKPYNLNPKPPRVSDKVSLEMSWIKQWKPNPACGLQFRVQGLRFRVGV